MDALAVEINGVNNIFIRIKQRQTLLKNLISSFHSHNVVVYLHLFPLKKCTELQGAD